jgi:hypothetical protein
MTQADRDGPDGHDLGQLPARVTDADLELFRSMAEAQFGKDTAETMLGWFQGPLDPEVIEALRQTVEEIRAADGLADTLPPPAEAFVESHERMRRLMGDLRVPDAEFTSPDDAAR